MTYTLYAFGYELNVAETGSGNWTGGYRVAGSSSSQSYTPVSESEFPDSDSAMAATCKAIQALALQENERAMNSCWTEALSAWTAK